MELSRVSRAGLKDTMDPHTVVASDTVYEGFIWDVQRDEFRMGDEDSTLKRDFITHPGAVSIVALDEQDRVLLINQYRHPVGMRMWEIPAGLLDVDGEPPHTAAQRELAEEADMTADDWHVLVDFHNSPGSSSEANRIFLARGLHEVPEADRHERDGEEAEIIFRFADLDDAVAAALSGQINSPAAVLGILAAHAARAQDWTSLRPVDSPWPGHPNFR